MKNNHTKIPKILMLCIALLFFVCNASWGQTTFSWDFGTTVEDLSPQGTDSHITVSSISRVNGGNSSTSTGTDNPSNGYSGASGDFHGKAATVSGAFNKNLSTYFEFTVNVEDGYVANIDYFGFGAQSDLSGPVYYGLYDGLGTFMGLQFSSSGSTWDIYDVSYANFPNPGFPIVGSTIFRLYGYGGSGGGGIVDWRIDDLTITLDVKPRPKVSMADQTICYLESAKIKILAGELPLNIRFKTKKDGIWVGGDGTEGNATIFTQTIASMSADSIVEIASADYGVFEFHLFDIIDANNLANIDPLTATVTVNPLPTASMEDQIICYDGGKAKIKVSGAPPLNIQFTTKKNGNPTGPFNRTIEASEIGPDSIVEIAPSDIGTFEFTFVSISDDNGCVNTSSSTPTATVKVNPLPTVSMEDQTICYLESAKVKVSGVAPLNIKFTTKKDGLWVVNSGGDPSNEHDAIIFNREIQAAEITDSIVNIASADYGVFEFHLISITDADDFENTAAVPPATVTVKHTVPTLLMDDQEICYGETAEIKISGEAPLDIKFNTEKNGLLVGEFNRHIEPSEIGADSVVKIASADFGEFRFELINITDKYGCVYTNADISGDPYFPAISAVVVVYSLPTVSISTTDLCEGKDVTLDFDGGTPPYTLVYTVNGANPSTIGLPASPLTVTGDTIITAGSAGAFEFELLSLTDANGCKDTAAPRTETITVKELPTVSIASKTNLCEGAGVQVAFTGTAAPFTLDYTVSVNQAAFVDPLTLGLPSPLTVYNSDTTIIGGSDGVFDFALVKLTDGDGCENTTPDTVRVIVASVAAPTVSMADQTICYGSSAEIFVTGAAPFDIQFKTKKNGEWVGGDGTEANATVFNRHIESTEVGVGGLVKIASEDSGEFEFYLINIKDDNGCENLTPVTAKVTVKELPTVSVSSTNICEGAGVKVTFTGTSSPFILDYTVGGVNPSTIGLPASPLTVSNSDTVIIGGSYGTFVFELVSLEEGSGCIDTVSRTETIIVEQTPVPTVSMANQEICYGDSASIAVTGSAPFDIKFKTKKNGDWVVEQGGNVNDENDAIIFNRHIAAEEITAGIAKIASADSGVFEFHLVSITDANGCENTAAVTATVKVNSLPTVSISTTALCEGKGVDLHFTGASPFTLEYTVNGVNPSTIGLPASPLTVVNSDTTIIAGSAGTFDFGLVKLTDGNGCKDNVARTETITVYPLPTVSVSKTEVCEGEGVEVTFTGKAPFTLDYTVNSVNPSTIGLPASPLTVSGNDTTIVAGSAGNAFVFDLVSLKDDNGCENLVVQTETIKVNPLPTVSVSTTTLCEGAGVQLDFTGTAPFTLEYTVDGNNPSTIGLPASPLTVYQTDT
ncbi:MAG: hypothetical protein LBQ28_10430, partial [Prevotellaceae bacterium]|nr:hypothetical protein [Prevotellaceae bacterium]